MSEGAIAGTEALLALNPIHERAQQKSKESEHEKENVIPNGWQTARRLKRKVKGPFEVRPPVIENHSVF